MKLLYSVLIGAVFLVVGCGDDDSEPSSSTVANEAVVIGKDVGVFDAGWEAVDAHEQGLDVESFHLIRGLPDGGFVAVDVFTWSFHASPDGKEWSDADPQELIARSLEYLMHEPIATTGDKVIVPNQEPPGVWIGDPLAGSWDLVAVDMTGLHRQPRHLAVAASNTEALLVSALVDDDDVATDHFEVDELVVWVIDLAARTSQRHQLPPSFTRLQNTGVGPHQGPPGSEAIAAWADGRWLVLPIWCGCSSIYSSADGQNWSESEMKWSSGADPARALEFKPGDGWSQSDIMRVAVGPDAMMVASRGAPHAYSEDASTWFAVDSQLDATWGGPSGTVVYSEELGFVTIVEGSGNILRMADDKVWELAGHVPAEVGLTTDVAASKDKILVKAGPRLWVWTD